jgi:hypothetical protein
MATHPECREGDLMPTVTLTRYAHTLAYDGRIVQGTQDGAPLPPGRWSVTRPTEVAVGEGSPAAR